MLHIQTSQIKNDLILQIKSDRENLITMANFAAKLYADGEPYDLMFESFKPIGLFSNIGILNPDNTFVTRMGSIDLNGKISFEDESLRGEYISGRISDLTRDNKDIIRLTVVFILTICLVFINPVGVEVFIYPYESIGNNLMLQEISEWNAPDAKQIRDLVLFFMPVFVMSLGFVVKKTKVRLIDISVMLIFMFLFFRSVRFIFIWYIAAVFCAFKYINKRKIRKKVTEFKFSLVLGWSVVLTIFCFFTMYNIYDLEKNQYISKVMSDEAVNVIKNDLPERLYNDYNLSESLIYNDIPVFFDARADLYVQDDIFEEGINFAAMYQINNEKENKIIIVDDYIKKYRFDAIVILKGRPLYSYLISHPDKFDIVYEDEMLAYFKINKEIYEI